MIIYWTKRLLFITAAAFIALCLCILVFVVAIHQEQPMQQSTKKVDATTARLAKDALSRNFQLLRQNSSQLEFKLSQAELTSVIAIGERTKKNIAATANYSNAGVYVELSVKSMFDRYINVSFLVIPSPDRLELSFLRVGSIELPTSIALSMLDVAIKSFTGIDIISHINHVSISQNTLHVGYNMTTDKQHFVQSLSHLAGRLGSEHSANNDNALTSYYFRQLQLLHRLPDACKRQPLSYFIEHLIRIEQPNNSSNYSAVTKNRAAIFALASYFGSYRFEYFLGRLDIKPPRKSRCYYIPTLGGRVDLTKHFLYSAAIELLSSTNTSEFIGELKELLDSNLNGSGFSFVDLMADHAGVRFAQLATQDEANAFALQQKIKQALSDQQLLPPRTQLPENLSQAQFEKAYQTIDAPAYRQLMAQIDNRLMALPIYQAR